jgi:para-nitrobenzyl esterase
VTEKDRAAARAVHAYFANFAKSGDPNGRDLPPWPKYDPARSDLMLFTLYAGPLVKGDPWKERVDLVERVAEAQRR